MKRFKDFDQMMESMEVLEGAYPVWVRMVVGGIVLRLRTLDSRMQSEEDPIKQNKIISQQNKLLGYINGLGVGISTNDKKLMDRMKAMRK
jgi:hypothetical protein